MKTKALLCLILLMWSGGLVASGKAAETSSSRADAARKVSHSATAENIFNLIDFGAVGDGVADDGPALQIALNTVAASGGGTLFVPAGRYAIITPVQKDFSGLASAVTIQGVESLTPVPPPTSSGDELSRGLDLLSEFAPRTGEQGIAINITGLQSFLIKDITFIGTAGVTTDASVTLALINIHEATIRHCEFYGLSSIVNGGAIVLSIRSDLRIQQSMFLGSTANSGVNAPVVQNLEWTGITVTDSVFVDYGQRAELYSKLDFSTPFSWVNIGNAAALTSDSPRREVVIRNVFLDEGAYFGLSSLPDLYQPPSAPIDLVYVTGLFMNVSNLGTTGHYFDGLENVLIENSHYGWSHNTESAIQLLGAGNAILDQVECVASANRILADAETRKLTVINSVYTYLDSQAPQTRVIVTETPDDDPVQYVRRQFSEILGREPDPAAHFYWSDQILECGDDSQCVANSKAALSNYLAAAPQEKFAVSGRVVDEGGAGLAGVTVALSGSQNVTAQTNAEGGYQFSNLPTSGAYTLTPSRRHYTLSPVSCEIVTPAADQIFNSSATFNHHAIGGRVADGAGNALADVTVTLSGAQDATMSTGADGNYSFGNLPAGGTYTVTPRKTSYRFSPENRTFPDLGADQNLNFIGTFVTYYVGGRMVGYNNSSMQGVTVTLSGSQNGTTTSDSTGTFSFTGLPSEGSYTVTPSLIGYSFDPSSKTFNNLAANQYHAYLATNATHSISGRVTDAASGTALSGAVVTLSGYTSGTTTTDANGNYNFSSLARGGDYTLTVSKAYCTFSEPSRTFNNLVSNQTANFDGSPQSAVEFSATSYTVSEDMRRISVIVNRTGDVSGFAEVVYRAIDGSAQQRDDVIPVIGKLSFEPGETSKSFIIFITDDAYVESSETLTLELSNLIGSTLGNNSSATLTIIDNDSHAAANPIDDAQFFVRQHYRDFLNRSADAEGLAFWSNQITSCGSDAACISDRRMNVSAAFFLSIEFQQTGFLVYRLYGAAFAQAPRHLDEFLLDTRTIGSGIVVNALGWEQLLETNKTAFIEDFVARSRFSDAYPIDLTPAEFVNQLNSRAGYPLAPEDIAAAQSEFGAALNSADVAARARVLRRVAENSTFTQRQLNPAFVLMQYFGYLERNPDETPDSNLDGYNFWLQKLQEFGGDFGRAEMVKSFLVSAEYRARFGTP